MKVHGVKFTNLTTKFIKEEITIIDTSNEAYKNKLLKNKENSRFHTFYHFLINKLR